MPNSDSSAATATASASDSAFVSASASASGSRSVVEDDATGEISSAPPAATSMPAADMSGSVDAEMSGAEILSQKPIMATGTAKAGPSVSGSNGLFTFTPLTLAPEKSKGVATASQNVAIASKPAVASAHTSDAGLMSLNNMAIAAVAAVAGLAML